MYRVLETFVDEDIKLVIGSLVLEKALRAFNARGLFANDLANKMSRASFSEYNYLSVSSF